MAINFLILGLPVVLVLWALWNRRPARWLRFALILLAVVFLAGAGLFTAEPKTLSSDLWYERSPWKEGVLLIVMLLGMAARSLDQAIEIRSQRIAQLRAVGKLRRKPKLPLDPWDFSRPFLVALPTFGGLLSQISDQALTWIVVTLAFQTGFFWQTILKKSEPISEESL